MTRERIGQLTFAGAFALSLVVYRLTLPDGIPFLPYSDLGGMDEDAWQYIVGAFHGRPKAATCVLASFAAGLLGALVNRHCGWRVAAGASLVWIFMPYVWYAAVTGDRSVMPAVAVVTGLWFANALMLVISKRSLKLRDRAASVIDLTLTGRGRRRKRRLAWIWLSLACLFAVWSLRSHDYRRGEAAHAFAQGVVEEAAGRIIVLNGVCDRQVMGLVWKTPGPSLRYLSMRETEANRAAFVSAVRQTFPNETNLWIAARIGAASFLAEAQREHAERFYLMTGESGTLAGWERRWAAFAPYLDTDDPFVPVARRQFAREGNALVNALPLETAEDRRTETETVGDACQPSPVALAWRTYWRIYEEICPGNLSALVNMSELIRCGYDAPESMRHHVRNAFDEFFREEYNRTHLFELTLASGPVRMDGDVLAKFREETRGSPADRSPHDGPGRIPGDFEKLIEWNCDMVSAMQAKDIRKAGFIARAILSRDEWRNFVPANGIMGTVAAHEGDYMAAESFFARATSTTNRVPTAILNDYADTLLKLGKLDEAEKWARRAVAESAPDAAWVAKLTLAQILDAAGSSSSKAEILSLLGDVLRYAPSSHRIRLREMQRKASRL